MFAYQKFRHYLEFNHFTVRTDHQALTQLLKHTGPNPRLTRLAMLLGSLDMELQYRKGTLHKNVDCLSRFPLEPPASDAVEDLRLYVHSIISGDTLSNDAQWLRREQEADTALQKITSALKDPTSQNFVE